MVAFGHTAVGVGVGLLGYHLLGAQNPAFGLLLTGSAGLVSHYIADFVPHGHFIMHQNYKSQVIYAIVFDLFFSVALFLGIAFWKYHFSPVLLYLLFGIGGAQLPDILDGFLYIGVIKKKGLVKLENDFHQATHWHAIFKNGKLVTGLPLGWRDLWQVATVIIALLLLYRF